MDPEQKPIHITLNDIQESHCNKEAGIAICRCGVMMLQQCQSECKTVYERVPGRKACVRSGRRRIAS